MKRIICCCSLVMAIGGAGCNTTNLLSSNRQKSDSRPVDSKSTTVSQEEFFASQKVKDPTKIHLAHAAWQEQSGNLVEARKHYLKVLEKKPKDTESMLGLARIDRAYGRESEADAQLNKTLKAHPKDPKVLVAIGQVHESKEEWPEALLMMKAAHEAAPYETIYEYHLAVVEARIGEIPSAIEHFTRSVGEAQAHYNVGYILNEQGRKTEAEFHLMKALKLKPDLKQAETALASLRTGKTDDVQPASFNQKDRRELTSY